MHTKVNLKIAQCARRVCFLQSSSYYNLPANLKSLACVVVEMSQNVPRSPVVKICSKCDEIILLPKSVYLPFMQNTWSRLLSQRARWLPKRWEESSSRYFDGRNGKISVSIDRQYTKLNKEMTGNFSVKLPCTADCNYKNGSISRTVNVSYTADFFEP